MDKVNGNALHDEEKPEIIYVFDALCGWCYGFSPVIQKLHEEFEKTADFLVLSGGMIKEEDAGPVGEMAWYIKQAYKQVEDVSGVKFGKEFLENVLEKGDAVFDSVTPARAMAVFRLEKIELAVDFAARLQKAIYFHGMLPGNDETYKALAAEFQLDPDTFVARMKTREIDEIVRNEFQVVAGMGVKGYPSVIVRKGGEMKTLSRGYMDYDALRTELMEMLKQ